MNFTKLSFIVLALIIAESFCSCSNETKKTEPDEIQIGIPIRVGPKDFSSSFSYYNTSPESPDGSKIAYTKFLSMPIDERSEKVPAEIWVCCADLTDHKKVVEEFIAKCEAAGDIYKDKYSGLYCTGCEQFYTDKDFEDNICTHHNRPLEKVEEESYFFKLSRYQDFLLDLYQNALEVSQNKDRITDAKKRLIIEKRVKNIPEYKSISKISAVYMMLIFPSNH